MIDPDGKNESSSETAVSGSVRIFGWLMLAAACIFNPWSLEMLTEFYWRVEHAPARPMLFIIDIIIALVAISLIAAPITTAFLRRLVKDRPRLVAVLIGTVIGLILIVFLLGGAEIYCRLTEPVDLPTGDGHHLTGATDEEQYRFDELLGYSPTPGISFDVRLVIDGREIYNVSYEMDRYGRRVTPINEGAEPTKFALFFGGSFAHGEGVEGDETIAAQFAAMQPDFRSYNYAFSGYGPQQMLARLQETAIDKEITEETGIAVFVYIDDHVRRAIGEYTLLNSFGTNFPYYVDKNGELERGSFPDSYPWLSILYNVMSRSKLVERLKIGYPVWLNDSHYRLTARIVEEARNSFHAKFGKLPFVVLIHPGCIREAPFVAYMEEAGIPVFNYGQLVNAAEDRYHFYIDWHPTPASNTEVARQLAEDVLEFDF